MKRSTTKKLIYVSAAAMCADLAHLKAEPHTHQESDEGPPIHTKAGAPAANVAITAAHRLVTENGPVVIDSVSSLRALAPSPRRPDH